VALIGGFQACGSWTTHYRGDTAKGTLCGGSGPVSAGGKPTCAKCKALSKMDICELCGRRTAKTIGGVCKACDTGGDYDDGISYHAERKWSNGMTKRRRRKRRNGGFLTLANRRRSRRRRNTGGGGFYTLANRGRRRLPRRGRGGRFVRGR
jgi:hypothetical protein